jgi:hypothetical protein
MSRAVIAFDRLMAFLIGLILVFVGAAAVLWWAGTFASWPGALDASLVLNFSTQPWWPWVAALLGAILIVLGLRWMAAHLPQRGVSQLKLPGSSQHGRLYAQVGPVAKTAAEIFGQTPGVRSAGGTIQRDQGQIIARLNAIIEPQADLQDIADAAARVSAELKQVLQRDDMRCQVRLRVARRGRDLPRVS